MSLANAVLSLSFFWILVHGLNAYVKRSRQVPLLPSNITNARWQSRSRLSDTSFFVSGLHLTVSTTAWNPFYDGMMEKLRTKAYTRTRSWMTVFYDVGFGIGFVGMLCAVFALVWLSGVLFWDLVQMMTQTSPSLRMQKREVTELPNAGVTVPQNSNIFITPIIPGVTVPLIHLPVILLAVFLCQIFHEFGHAMSAALESISLLSVGASVNVIFPSAHVSFPPRQIENLSPRRKGRIIAGGPWHNIVMWLLLFGIGRTFIWLNKSIFIGDAFLELLYEDIGHIGRVVVNVEEGSPLKDFLLVGSIVTHVDDIPLAGTRTGEEIWSSYLSGKGSEDLRALSTKGWCVPRDTFKEGPNSCCSGNQDISTLFSCFNRKDTSLEATSDRNKSCLDPIDVLTHSPPLIRCVSDEECRGQGNHREGEPDTICIVPDEDTTSFTRLTIRHDGNTTAQTVLWSGPRIEIWEQVEISRWAPRFWFVPVKTLLLAACFLEYLVTASLSLFFFNLLPVPLLDGGQLLKAVLGNLPEIHVRDFDVESMRSRRTPGRWKARIEKTIMYWTTGMSSACVLMAIIRTMKT